MEDISIEVFCGSTEVPSITWKKVMHKKVLLSPPFNISQINFHCFWFWNILAFFHTISFPFAGMFLCLSSYFSVAYIIHVHYRKFRNEWSQSPLVLLLNDENNAFIVYSYLIHDLSWLTAEVLGSILLGFSIVLGSSPEETGLQRITC